MSCGELRKEGKWRPLGWMVRRTMATPAHWNCWSLGFQDSVRPASDWIWLSGSRDWSWSNWHSFCCWNCWWDPRELLIIRSKQREKTKSLAMGDRYIYYRRRETALSSDVVKRRAGCVSIYRGRRRRGRDTYAFVCKASFAIFLFAWLWWFELFTPHFLLQGRWLLASEKKQSLLKYVATSWHYLPLLSCFQVNFY